MCLYREYRTYVTCTGSSPAHSDVVNTRTHTRCRNQFCNNPPYKLYKQPAFYMKKYFKLAAFQGLLVRPCMGCGPFSPAFSFLKILAWESQQCSKFRMTKRHQRKFRLYNYTHNWYVYTLSLMYTFASIVFSLFYTCTCTCMCNHLYTYMIS